MTEATSIPTRREEFEENDGAVATENDETLGPMREIESEDAPVDETTAQNRTAAGQSNNVDEEDDVPMPEAETPAPVESETDAPESVSDIFAESSGSSEDETGADAQSITEEKDEETMELYPSPEPPAGIDSADPVSESDSIVWINEPKLCRPILTQIKLEPRAVRFYTNRSVKF